MSYINDLARVMDSEKYKGCTIMRVKGGWRTLGKTYSSKDDARAAIDKALASVTIK